MSKYRVTFFIKFDSIFLSSCAVVKEGFKSSRKQKTSNDEFLVEKKSPLIMPPNYQ
jgi:hypothetical protein